jgi:hypothetical protein
LICCPAPVKISISRSIGIRLEVLEQLFDLPMQLYVTLDEIVRDPERFARIDERHRERLVKRFPFRVIYRILDNRIIVVAIAHAKRNPDYWKSR